ncbi:MAG TPA: hypothetical protein VEV13_02720 [Candidatus Limnocylindria bacterium]|nr:hypothetical protein [Candidatus Limnocylindria bacterium]
MDAATTDQLAVEVRRLADRLRTVSDVRLSQPFPGSGTRAAAALDLAQQLAEAAQGVECRDAEAAPGWRVVPELGVFALGDQLAVTGHDLVAAASDVAGEALVWTRAGRRTASEVVEEQAQAVRALRQAL